VYNSVSKYPEIRRDLAIVLDSTINSRTICQHIQELGGKLLKNIAIFDVYVGKNIEQGKRSIALALLFQEPTRTLVDSEINSLMQTIIESLTNTFNATLRN